MLDAIDLCRNTRLATPTVAPSLFRSVTSASALARDWGRRRWDGAKGASPARSRTEAEALSDSLRSTKDLAVPGDDGMAQINGWQIIGDFAAGV